MPCPNQKHPRIFVACLAAFNKGFLCGQWIDAAQNIPAIQQQIKNILSDSPITGTEEFIILRAEGFGSLRIDKDDSIKKVQKLASFIATHGPLGLELLALYESLEPAQMALNNDYQGEYGSEVEFATQLFQELYQDSVPKEVFRYIHYEAYKADLFHSAFHSFEIEGKVHVFAQS